VGVKLDEQKAGRVAVAAITPPPDLPVNAHPGALIDNNLVMRSNKNFYVLTK